MVGRTPLLDNRCLWMDLSLPENNISEQGSNYTLLQQVWPTWSQWWQPYFEQHLP
jgi:cyanosortase A-associated protein